MDIALLDSTCNVSYTSDTCAFMIGDASDFVSIDGLEDDVNDITVETKVVYEHIYPNGPDYEPIFVVGEALFYCLIH